MEIVKNQFVKNWKILKNKFDLKYIVYVKFMILAILGTIPSILGA